MERKEFLKSIQTCRQKLNRAELIKNLVFSFCIGAGVGILFQIVAFVVPFYWANSYSLLALLIAALTALTLWVHKRKNMYQTALFMDSFGFRERIITAYEHLDEEGEMVRLQREDAMRQLQAHKERIRISMIKDWKQPVLMLALMLTMTVMMLLPSEVKKQAKELHQIREEAKEQKEEIKEVLEEMEKLTQEELTPEQLAVLQEMMESLKSSMQEYEQVDTTEMLETANQKLDYKYDNMQQQFTNMAAAAMMQSGATISPQSLQTMKEMAEKMQELGENGNMDGNPSLAGNQGQDNGQVGNDQNGNGTGNQQNNGQNPGENGETGNGQVSGQNGQNTQNGNGQGQGQENGQGAGSGNGQGQGNGQGNSSSNTEGNGSGRGEGNGSAPHDYVSIPNEIMDSGNLTGTATGHEDSDFFRIQNGLSWEGNHVSHEAVIGSYEKNAYEGIAAGKYPSGMEEVIKEYFASFN